VYFEWNVLPDPASGGELESCAIVSRAASLPHCKETCLISTVVVLKFAHNYLKGCYWYFTCVVDEVDSSRSPFGCYVIVYFSTKAATLRFWKPAITLQQAAKEMQTRLLR
jgi:hypothetical protein